MLRVEGLTVMRGHAPLTFEVPAGQCVGLLGSSATLTSRLLCAAAGLSQPLTGSVLIDGREARHRIATARRQVSITRPECVPARLRLREYLQTVSDVRRAGGTSSRATVTAAIERLCLDGARALSTPAARREAALAAAILPAVSLVILDQPFDGVSAETRAGAIEWIRALAADSVAVLIGGREERDLRAVSHSVISARLAP